MRSQPGRDRRDTRLRRGTSRFGAKAGALALAGTALFIGVRGLAGCGGSPDDLFTSNPDFTATKNERLGRVLTTTGETVASPAYVAFAEVAAELETETATFCGGPSAERLRTVQAAWRRTMSAWLFASVPQFGPIRDDNRSLRIEFWPDANNNVPRAVEQLLASGEPISADVLAGRSVAAQGLPALEQLLFDPDADPLAAFLDPASGSRRCDAIRAMSTNLAAIAADVATAWQPSRGDYAEQLARSGVEGGAFATRGAAVEEVINSMITVIERTKNDRLAKPLALPGGGSPVLARAESHRSRTSLANVARALEALRALYLGGEGAETAFGFDDFLRLGTEASLDGRIQRLFESTIDRARALPASFTDLLADPAAQPELSILFTELTELTGLLKNDLAEATGVVVGFNENDGD
jgi:predicted lipoprotein